MPPISRNWSSRFRTDQVEYVWLILLASLIGALAALGNLGFRLLIDFSSSVFLGFEWRALEIEKAVRSLPSRRWFCLAEACCCWC